LLNGEPTVNMEMLMPTSESITTDSSEWWGQVLCCLWWIPG